MVENHPLRYDVEVEDSPGAQGAAQIRNGLLHGPLLDEEVYTVEQTCRVPHGAHDGQSAEVRHGHVGFWFLLAGAFQHRKRKVDAVARPSQPTQFREKRARSACRVEVDERPGHKVGDGRCRDEPAIVVDVGHERVVVPGQVFEGIDRFHGQSSEHTHS